VGSGGVGEELAGRSVGCIIVRTREGCGWGCGRPPHFSGGCVVGIVEFSSGGRVIGSLAVSAEMEFSGLGCGGVRVRRKCRDCVLMWWGSGGAWNCFVWCL